MQVRDLRGRGAVQDAEFARVDGSQIGKQMRVVVARATPRVVAVYCYPLNNDSPRGMALRAILEMRRTGCPGGPVRTTI
jgi:hypothetical protein